MPSEDRCAGGVRAEPSTASRPGGSGKVGVLLKLAVFSGEVPGDGHKGKLGNTSASWCGAAGPHHTGSLCRRKMNLHFTCWTLIFTKRFWNIQIALLVSALLSVLCVSF